FRWSEMLRWLEDQTGVVVIESNVLPHEMRERLRLNPSTVIEVKASREVRERRLTERDGNWKPKRYPVGAAVDRTVSSGPAGVEAVIATAKVAQTVSQSQKIGGRSNHDLSGPD